MSLADISNEIFSNFENIAGKLTLFPENQNKAKQNEIEKTNILERPVTPLEHEIQDAPKSLNEFLYLLERRIQISKEALLSEEDQLSLLGILESEITLLWPDLKNLVDYPLFNFDQNKELRSSIFIDIILKCQQLFLEYINKLDFYCSKDIFSDESNLVRIKLQLASDIRNKLHIPTLRRKLYQNISQDIHLNIPKCCETPSIAKVEDKFQHEVHDTSRRTVEETANICLPTKTINGYHRDESEKIKSSSNETVRPAVVDNASSAVLDSEQVFLKDQIHMTKLSNKEDLVQLMIDDGSDTENDSFPNMNHAMPSLNKQVSRNLELQRKIEILQKRNDATEESATFVCRRPKIEQPSTIPKCYNNRIYYVPDIRPTERKSDYEIKLSFNGPVWNELADEITPEIVKQLDSNLFRGEEVKDIYKEMMKTVSRDYLSYTDDAIIEDCPPKVYIQDIMASHTLYSDLKKDRIINSDLKKFINSPWNSESKQRAEWEQPNYSLNSSASADLDLKQYVAMSIDELSHKLHLMRGSYGESLSSAVTSTRDHGTSLGNLNEFAATSRATPIRNIISKRDYVMKPDKLEKGISRLPKLMQDRVIKQYKEWLSMWKGTFTYDDYLKYLSLQPSDFLSVVFHTYDSDGEDNAEDNEDFLYPEIVEDRVKMAEREKERVSLIESKVLELQNEKMHFEKGLWNPSIILIGGLGKIPTLSHKEKNELLKDKPALPDPNDRLSKMSAYSRAQSAVSPGKPTPLFTRKKNAVKLSDTSESQFLNTVDEEKISAIQNRLEQIWVKLKMPNHLRLDMAIKYSAEINNKTIEMVLKQWEMATDLLTERECILSDLEKFERNASDPNRFFAKGYRGSSLARIDEAKTRQDLNEKLDQCSIKVSMALKSLKTNFSDELSFEGRPYKDKMTWDRTEMLYWLQEERKERSLNGIVDFLTIN